jgi:RNA polymerase sigma-70 factor (ECF subfamily)
VSAFEHDAGEDARLVALVARHDRQAFGLLYERYKSVVYTIALRITGDRELAEDVLQDVFFRCWQKAGTFRPDRGRVAPWLMGMARNRSVDVLRGRQQQARVQGMAELAEHLRLRTASAPDEEAVLRQDVAAALALLSPLQREAIELALYGGLTHAEVAEVIGAPLGTVKTRIRDGMQRLKLLLAPHLALETGEAAGPGHV